MLVIFPVFLLRHTENVRWEIGTAGDGFTFHTSRFLSCRWAAFVVKDFLVRFLVLPCRSAARDKSYREICWGFWRLGEKMQDQENFSFDKIRVILW